MEQQPPTESLFELQVDYESGNYFKETARWSKFISIVAFCFIGFYSLFLLFAGTVLVNALSTYMSTVSMPGAVLVLVVIVVIAVFLFLCIQLYRFASMVKAGLTYNDQQRFNTGLRSLKNYFLVSSIISILSTIFSVLGFINGLF